MARKRFEHLLTEICDAVGRPIPRYRLWLRLAELGFEPEALSRAEAITFCDEQLEAFLAERGLCLSPWARRHLRACVGLFDATQVGPEEWSDGPGAATE